MKIKNKRIFLSILIVVLFAAACSSAKRSSEVRAAYIPSYNYEGKTCQQILLLAEEFKQKTPALEMRVDEARRQDKIKEQVGLWLFWPSYFFMEGNALQQTDLALAKGNLNALRTAAIKNNCNVSRSRAVTEISSIKLDRNTQKNSDFMQTKELNDYLEEIFKAKVDREALRQILKLYEKGVITKSSYEMETKKILDQADKEMLNELQKLLDKGLITLSKYEDAKKGILVKSN